MTLIVVSKENHNNICKDPYIHSADRLPNDTIRIYRDNYYWELIGLPDRVALPKGPYKILFDYMGPVTQTSAITTIVGGKFNGNVFKFDKTRYWQWKADGRQVIGQKDGVDMSKGNFPPEGFNCVFNDGSLDKRWPGPRMIAFNGIYVTYWNTNFLPFRPIGKTNPGYKGGNYGEKFPPDITACVAFKMDNKKTPLWVYLFKRDKYCFRPITDAKECEWRDNRELFNCNSQTNQNTDKNDYQDIDTILIPTQETINSLNGSDNQSPKNEGQEQTIAQPEDNVNPNTKPEDNITTNPIPNPQPADNTTSDLQPTDIPNGTSTEAPTEATTVALTEATTGANTEASTEASTKTSGALCLCNQMCLSFIGFVLILNVFLKHFYF
ncbi:uncharacterized protein LOC128960218 [Oppia nitens]|uniref:uncharacterized protein LOC128960218 n=1 Tax=Oppia nitens TaxID=1686743 RepID=UPI0023DCEB63|nr:uncharacterized protein LOC128960218 [Oppia nitens]